jgi:hypothetical protein
MRYDEFRDRLQDHLRAAGLFFKDVDRPIEIIYLADTDRRWKVCIGRSAPQKADPLLRVREDRIPMEPLRRRPCVHLRRGPPHGIARDECHDDVVFLADEAPLPRRPPGSLRRRSGFTSCVPAGRAAPSLSRKQPRHPIDQGIERYGLDPIP